MKKVLLGSTALVAASLLAGPAFAQLELSISGSVDVHAGFADEDEVAGGASSRGYGFTTDTTLNFNADGTTDNGLEYGVRINLDDETVAGSETTSTTGGGTTTIDTVAEAFLEIDETWVFVSGSFGEVRFGETDPAASELRFAIPTVGNGQADGDFQRYIIGPDGDVFGTDFEYSGDDTKIVYIGEFGDFTVGASFSPSDAARGDKPEMIENDGNFQAENIFSIGGNYQGDFQGVSVGVSAGYNAGDFESVAAPLVQNLNDFSEWGVGGEVGFGQITAGGFWISTSVDSVAGDLDLDKYGLGATFTTGPWGFAANALIAETDLPGAGNDSEDTVYGVGVEYSLADGLTPYADLVFFDFDNPGAGPGNDNDGSVFLVGITASF